MNENVWDTIIRIGLTSTWQCLISTFNLSPNCVKEGRKEGSRGRQERERKTTGKETLGTSSEELTGRINFPNCESSFIPWLNKLNYLGNTTEVLGMLSSENSLIVPRQKEIDILLILNLRCSSVYSRGVFHVESSGRFLGGNGNSRSTIVGKRDVPEKPSLKLIIFLVASMSKLVLREMI